MRIAVPVAEGRLSTHFGHCERFAMITVDQAEKKILKREDVAGTLEAGANICDQ